MGKRWGQHFLRDTQAQKAIVEALHPAIDESILEIGPGRGALTQHLLRQQIKLVALEIDPTLVESLQAQYPKTRYPTLRVYQVDARHAEWHPQRWFENAEPYAIVANLPYYLSTPLLFRLLNQRRYLSRLVLMLQREVALRMLAQPRHGKAYAALSIAMQYGFEISSVLAVPRQDFVPMPQVDSMVLRLVPRAPLLEAGEERAFLDHLKALFSRRRKQLATILRQIDPARTSTALPPSLSTNPPPPALPPQQDASENALPPDWHGLRPENLSPAQHLCLFRQLRKHAEHL